MSITGSWHGILRGADAVSRSRIFEGRFGRMFRDLPSAEFGKTPEESERVLKRLGAEMISEAVIPDSEESKIPAGYTYLGQFIDHDITFDPSSSLQRDNDPDGLVDYRTPRFDLDSIYGRGPSDQPYLYRKDLVRMILGQRLTGGVDKLARDVPRNVPMNNRVERTDPDLINSLLNKKSAADTARCRLPDRNTLRSDETSAIIGDPRNDENVIIAQLHAMFLRFHNWMADQLKAKDGGADFGEIQRMVRWHYQWVILNDFLPKVVVKQIYNEYLPYIAPKSSSDVLKRPQLQFYRPRDEAYIPVEFSAAAYRFGHSMVRFEYRLNRSKRGGPFPILGKPQRRRNDEDLRGFGLFFPNWAIDWDLFFDGVSSKLKQKRYRINHAQRAFKIDTSLAGPLAKLPFPFAKNLPSLSQRNLIRGWRLGLPSGEAIAQAMGFKPIADPKVKRFSDGGKPKLTSTASISGALKGNTPLWFYILAEAQELCDGQHLGPVGSRILMETFLGLMIADHHSFLSQDPLWKPESMRRGDFGMAEFIKEASRV
jgi:heme peroxidase